jgi:hypothetical protein
MSKRMVFPGLAQFLAATAGRNMTKPAYVAVVIGVLMVVILSVDSAYEAAYLWIDAVLWGCLGFFAFEWLVRIRFAAKIGRASAYLFSGRGLVDAAGAIAVPLALMVGADPKTAWLFAVVWLVKVIPGIPGLRQLRRVLVLESGPILSVLVLFLMVLFLGSVTVYFLERDAQPETFGNVPSALWWAVVTLTTTGYGDAVPITPLGRIVAAVVMICGLGVFGLWTGILATGFAAETRRDLFLRIRQQGAVLRHPWPVGDRRRDAYAAHHRPAAACDDHPQGSAGRLHVFHRLRRGRGRSAGQKGAARRRRVLRRDGLARQQSALRQHRHHTAVETVGTGPRRLSPLDGAPSRPRRDHRRGSQPAGAGE